MNIEIKTRFDEQYRYWVAETHVSTLGELAPCELAPCTADDESTALHMALEIVSDELRYHGFVPASTPEQTREEGL